MKKLKKEYNCVVCGKVDHCDHVVFIKPLHDKIDAYMVLFKTLDSRKEKKECIYTLLELFDKLKQHEKITKTNKVVIASLKAVMRNAKLRDKVRKDLIKQGVASEEEM